jgi:hypothetical protein
MTHEHERDGSSEHASHGSSPAGDPRELSEVGDPDGIFLAPPAVFLGQAISTRRLIVPKTMN